MASRSSANWNSEQYQGSRRGREIAYDIDFSQFPEKYESTSIIENPDQIYEDRRLLLQDYTPENSAVFEYEEPRRNTYARSHLNLRDGGVFGSTADPYVTNGQYDTQFHDKDPRGWSPEQPWQEYRRVLESKLKMTDFKDDGDYSTTGGGISPYSLYAKIRGAQNWTKARLKIFDTEFDAQSNGGVGVYPHVSNVFKSSNEDTSVLTDGSGLARTFEDPENRQRLTMKLSNIVHGGSPILRTNETTDHKVKVAAYGKLYKQRGLTPHESQMRVLEDDTPWSRIEGAATAPKNLVKLMATALQDRGDSSDTAAQSARLLYQNAAMEGAHQEQFTGMARGESTLDNRNLMMTRDIMALLGFTENEVKFLESRNGENRRGADHALANLYEMAQTLHAMPANMKLELRNELLLRSAGAGLRPAQNVRGSRNQVIVNPKIISFMEIASRRTKFDADPIENRASAIGDSEGRLDTKNTPIFVYKSSDRALEDVDRNRRGADSETKTIRGDDRVISYRNLARELSRLEKNSRESRNTQLRQDATEASVGKNWQITDLDIIGNLMKAETEMKYRKNNTINRHAGRLGTKDTRRYIQSDEMSRDYVNELSANVRSKNPKNRRDAN